MPKLKNLKGQRFGNLTVINRDENTKSGTVRWICKCDCGKTVGVSSGNLQSGNTKSCGCKKGEMIGKKLTKDLAGMKFGYYTVLKKQPPVNGKTVFLCQCDCGVQRNVLSTNLIRGLTKSCGCKSSEMLSKTNKIDISGERYGKLAVIKMLPNTIGDAKFECKCDCGNKIIVRAPELKNNKTKSCGCLLRKSSGLSGDRIYREWINIRQRCKNKKHTSYKDYGGRGIEVCDEWDDSFINFYEWAINNGYTDDLSIDRIDVNGNYEPSNCRWVTIKQQNNNKRNTVFITYNGQTKSVSEWSEVTGISTSVLYRRKKYGWPDESCIEGFRK